MTSEQIKATPHFDLSVTHWLKELCYQVALMNERSTLSHRDIPAIRNKHEALEQLRKK